MGKPVAVEPFCDHALMRGQPQSTGCKADHRELLKQCGQSPISRQLRDLQTLCTDIVRLTTEDINLTKRARQPASECKSLNEKLAAARDNVCCANKRIADLEVQLAQQRAIVNTCGLIRS
ncbi:hypothetical protein [Streptomyces sp. NPDC002078]